MNITLSRPHHEDLPELEEFFRAVISYAFEADGIGDRENGKQSEVSKQMGFIQSDLNSNGEEIYFLLARLDNKIIGTIGYAPAEKNEFIRKNLNIDLTNIPEITSVYVHPDFHGHGIGSFLFNSMLLTLMHNGVKEICLDGGYQKSQKFWIHKMGEPNYISYDHFGPGLNYMIWYRRLNDLDISFPISS